MGSAWLAYLVLVLPTMAADSSFEPPDVHEIERSPDSFIGRDCRIIGRFDSAAARRMRLVDSKIDFRLGDRVRLHANPKHVLVTGRLEREQNHLVFRVDALFKIPSETERFAEFKKKLSQSDFQVLYELAHWAQQRAQWYQNPDLKKLADAATRQALRWEEDQLAQRGDVQGLMALADRAKGHAVPDEDVVEVLFHGFYRQLSKLPADDASARLLLATQIARRLPDAKPPGKERHQVLDTDAQHVIENYRLADRTSRRIFQRELYCQAVTEALAIELATGKSDVAALAEQAKKLVPEDRPLALKLELLALEQKVGDIHRLSREEAIRLAGQFTKLGQPMRADKLLGDWLEAQRGRLAEDDLESRIALAADYLELKHDPDTAANLYRQALAIAPSREAELGLEQLDYVKIGRQWVRRGALTTGQAANRRASVEPNDSEGRVLELLHAPSRISRTAGAGWILEQWRYDGPPALWIYMRRSPATGQATVSRVAAP